VVATGIGPLSYQWQKNGANIPGATSTTYTTPPTVPADFGSTFRCVVTNAGGSVTSNSATLTVSPPATPPYIVTHPSSLSVVKPATAIFSVTAGGSTPLSYQWQVNKGSGWFNATAGDGSGGTTASLTTVATTLAMSGYQYRCVVTNAYGTAPPSNAATLTVNLDPSLDEDNDGLSNGDETSWTTDPTDPDSDNDGIEDGDEVWYYGTDPTDPDSDGDSYTDKQEIDGGTNPSDPNPPYPTPADGGGGCGGGHDGPAAAFAWLLPLAAAAAIMRRRRATA